MGKECQITISSAHDNVNNLPQVLIKGLHMETRRSPVRDEERIE